MRQQPFWAAAAVIALLAGTSSARAGDTVLLGGVGSSAERFAFDAPAMTLKGLPNDVATLEKMHYGFSRPWGGFGFYRPWGGLGFNRPWSWGFRPWSWGFRPWFGYYRPWFGFYRPWFGFARPWWGVGFYRPWNGISWASAPALAINYSPVTCAEPMGVATQILPTPAVAVRPGPEPLPTPVRPVVPAVPAPPAPGVAPPPAFDEPMSGRRATTTRVSSKSKLTYPAYGESPAKPAPRTNSFLVNTPGH
jgi:hypothetical protein